MISPFEEHVLRLLTDVISEYEHQGVYASASSWDICAHGRVSLQDDQWGGYGIGAPGEPTFPVINLALGRLAKQGLVKRLPSNYATSLGLQSGLWILTEQGRLYMGLPSLIEIQ